MTGLLDSIDRRDVHIISHADDIALVGRGKSAYRSIQQSIDTLAENARWLGLAFSVQKICYLLFHTRHPRQALTLYGQPIRREHTACYLGVILDDKLT